MLREHGDDSSTAYVSSAQDASLEADERDGSPLRTNVSMTFGLNSDSDAGGADEGEDSNGAGVDVSNASDDEQAATSSQRDASIIAPLSDVDAARETSSTTARATADSSTSSTAATSPMNTTQTTNVGNSTAATQATNSTANTSTTTVAMTTSTAGSVVTTTSTAQSSTTQTTSNTNASVGTTSEYVPFTGGPPAGNPDGACAVPEDARLEDVSQPDQVVGNGTPSSCTANAFINAVAQGGVITFNCGPEPVVITLDRPAKVFNDANRIVTIDGGGLVTLSGGGTTRILYMNTCDQDQVWTTAQCDNQDHPRLSVQNLTFIDGNSKNETEFAGGGAIYASGGRFKVINSRFFNNVCDDDGPDVGGAGIRVFQQYNSLPAYVVNSTFGGAPELGNVCSNGGGISSIGVSWTVLNSVFSYNQAIGFGGNPPDPNTLGGGSGGAIYNDGNTMTLTVCGSLLEHNQVNMYGSSIFFVSNNHTGSVFISNTISRNNTGGGWDALWPGISLHEDTYVSVDDASIIE